MATVKDVEKAREATNVKLFGKWSFNELEVRGEPARLGAGALVGRGSPVPTPGGKLGKQHNCGDARQRTWAARRR